MSAIAAPRTRGLTRVRPGWARISLIAVLVLAAGLCLWNLTISGYSNEYYAAAARAGAESWKAWFFGAIDPGSFITVDKPPLSLWLMGLSARIFGFSSFSILLPQALCTVASVGLLYATVRRVAGETAGLIAAAALALTPITIAVGRVNNPDALLVLLLVASAYFTVRAIESGRGKHLAFAGADVGLAFMTKMLQGWMVEPALAAANLLAGKPSLLVRVRQLAVAGVVAV
jgi:4-amino-4-deoxy-L-arabinose transferase-like glycosyltransferase